MFAELLYSLLEFLSVGFPCLLADIFSETWRRNTSRDRVLKIKLGTKSSVTKVHDWRSFSQLCCQLLLAVLFLLHYGRVESFSLAPIKVLYTVIPPVTASDVDKAPAGPTTQESSWVREKKRKAYWNLFVGSFGQDSFFWQKAVLWNRLMRPRSVFAKNYRGPRL